MYISAGSRAKGGDPGGRHGVAWKVLNEHTVSAFLSFAGRAECFSCRGLHVREIRVAAESRVRKQKVRGGSELTTRGTCNDELLQLQDFSLFYKKIKRNSGM